MNPSKLLSTPFLMQISFLITFLNGNSANAQRIVTIQLDGTQYYVSRMNPYSSELNYFLAYQYCRSIGLQLASFETKEKADAMTEYLKNAGYSDFDFWTSGNHLGSNMLLWMSTGLPFNATFNYMRKFDSDEILPSGPLPMGRKKRGNGLGVNSGCIAIKAHEMDWDTEDCSKLKDFICEQTRCYFYNYGSIPVSPAQGSYFNNKHKDQNFTTNSSTTQKQQQLFTENILEYLSTKTSPNPKPTSTSHISVTTATPLFTISSSSSVQYENHPESETDSSNNEQQISSNEQQQPSGGGGEEESNEIDLNTTTDTPTSDYAYVTNEKQDEVNETVPPPVAAQPPQTQRTIKVLDPETDSNSARHMPNGPQQQDSSLPAWPWFKNILLEKPVLKKTSQV